MNLNKKAAGEPAAFKRGDSARSGLGVNTVPHLEGHTRIKEIAVAVQPIGVVKVENNPRHGISIKLAGNVPEGFT